MKKQDQMNLDLRPLKKTIQVQSNQYFATKDHKTTIQDHANLQKVKHGDDVRQETH